MKRLIALGLALLALFVGCDGDQRTMDQALQIRGKLLEGDCTFVAQISADYADMVHTFTLACRGDREGNLSFSVVEPDSIAGITGVIEANGGKLTFDDVVLSFPMLADGQLTPVSAPWIFLGALRGGYIAATGPDGEHTRITVIDTFSGDALTVDIWLNSDNIPVFAEIEWDNRRILTIQIENFALE